eukprot:72203-Rhodomonas_salina.1
MCRPPFKSRRRGRRGSGRVRVLRDRAWPWGLSLRGTRRRSVDRRCGGAAPWSISWGRGPAAAARSHRGGGGRSRNVRDI